MAAASKGHREVIKVLLKYGADILLTSFEVRTTVHNLYCILIYKFGHPKRSKILQ